MRENPEFSRRLAKAMQTTLLRQYCYGEGHLREFNKVALEAGSFDRLPEFYKQLIIKAEAELAEANKKVQPTNKAQTTV
jgi:hypothetical protein